VEINIQRGGGARKNLNKFEIVTFIIQKKENQ
jgi:hypothetical protein